MLDISAYWMVWHNIYRFFGSNKRSHFQVFGEVSLPHSRTGSPITSIHLLHASKWTGYTVGAYAHLADVTHRWFSRWTTGTWDLSEKISFFQSRCVKCPWALAHLNRLRRWNEDKSGFLLLVYISSLLWEAFFLLNLKKLQCQSYLNPLCTSAEVSRRLILTCLAINLSSLTIVLCFLPLLCLSLISNVSLYLLTVYLTV